MSTSEHPSTGAQYAIIPQSHRPLARCHPPPASYRLLVGATNTADRQPPSRFGLGPVRIVRSMAERPVQRVAVRLTAQRARHGSALQLLVEAPLYNSNIGVFFTANFVFEFPAGQAPLRCTRTAAMHSAVPECPLGSVAGVAAVRSTLTGARLLIDMALNATVRAAPIR